MGEKIKGNKEKVKKSPRHYQNLPSLLEIFSLERKHIWACECMTCSLLNAEFSETSFILLDIPSLPEGKSVSSACPMLVVTPQP